MHPYLKKIRQAYAAMGRAEVWEAYAARLREEHKLKRLFMDLLDGIEGKPIA